jgi:hypothetical protein
VVVAAAEEIDGDVVTELAGCLPNAQPVVAGGDGRVDESVEQLLSDALVSLRVCEHGQKWRSKKYHFGMAGGP